MINSPNIREHVYTTSAHGKKIQAMSPSGYGIVQKKKLYRWRTKLIGYNLNNYETVMLLKGQPDWLQYHNWRDPANHVISPLTSMIWLYPRFFVFEVHTGWWGIEYRTRDLENHNPIIAKVYGADARDDGYLYEHKTVKT